MKDSDKTVSPFLNLLDGALKATCFVCGTCLLAILLEWCGMQWKDWPYDRLQQRTQSELQYVESLIQSDYHLSLLLRTIQSTASLTDGSLLPIERFLVRQLQEFEAAPSSVAAVSDVLGAVQRVIYRHTAIALEVLRSSMFRLVMLVFGLLSVAPIVVVGFIDGLVRREVRRWSGGRENAWMFVVYSKSVPATIAVVVGVYLVWPWDLPFAWVNAMTGLSLLCGLSIAASMFKKYL